VRGNIRRKTKSRGVDLGQQNRDGPIIAICYKKFGPSGNGQEGVYVSESNVIGNIVGKHLLISRF